MEILKMLDDHNNIGSWPESQVTVQQVCGTNKAHLAFGICVRSPTKACGSNGAMNAKKQTKATTRLWICVIPIKTQMNDPAGSLQRCANQWRIDNEQTESRLEELQQESGRMKAKWCKMFWWTSGHRRNPAALFLYFSGVSVKDSSSVFERPHKGVGTFLSWDYGYSL